MPSIISASTTSGTALNFTADTSGVLALQTGSTPTTAITIDGSQNVGIGTASPSVKLEVVGSSGAATSIFRVGTNGSGGIIWRNASNASVGFVQVNSDQVHYASTNDGSGAYLQKSGITFPATQSASSDANTLDDYEEGTFTPTAFYVSGTTGTQTYTTQVGRYIKIGKLVCANIRLAFSKNTLSGGFIGGIAGLPFTSSTTGSIATISNVAWYNPGGTGFIICTAYLDPNKTQIDIYRTVAANVDSAVLPISIAEMGTSIVLGLNHYYYTD